YRRTGAMFSRVDGSMATAAPARRTGGGRRGGRRGGRGRRGTRARRRGRAQVPAVSVTRRCRKDEPKKDEPKRSAGNTGNTGNPCRNLARPIHQRYQALRWIGRAAGLRRMGGRKLAETGGNSRSGPPALRNRGYDGGGMEKASE